MTTRTLAPDPDCRICHGSGDNQCDCTKVCDCGEERPDNLESCAMPGCVSDATRINPTARPAYLVGGDDLTGCDSFKTNN